jgi:hypothetical protein
MQNADFHVVFAKGSESGAAVNWYIWRVKSFFKKLALFACCGLLAAFALQWLIAMRIAGKNVALHDTLHISGRHDELVLLGSSRCWAQFDPGFYKKEFGISAVNIGVSGHSEIALATIRLENYLSKNRAPRYVIFNFDPLASPDSTNASENFTAKNAFARYAFWPDPRDSAFLGFFKFNAAERYLPAYALLRYKLLQACLFPGRPNPYNLYGYENNTQSWDTLRVPVNHVLRKYFFTAAQRPAIVSQLRKLKACCERRGIRLLCLQAPVYKSLYDKRFFDRSGAVCRQAGVPLLDLSSDESIMGDISCFYNSDHLNRKGVERLNAALARSGLLREFLDAPRQR